jgi:hypothetical protein
MQKVPETRTVSKAYYAHYYDEAGAIPKARAACTL